MSEQRDNIVDLAALRAQVEARRKAEADHLAGAKPQDKPDSSAGGPDDPRFVLRCLEHNERGDGILYAALHRGRYVYVKSRDEKAKAWFRWAKHHWEIDKGDFHHNAVEDVALCYQSAADAIIPQIVEARDTLAEAAAKVDRHKEIAARHKKSGDTEAAATCEPDIKAAEAEVVKAKIALGKLTRTKKDLDARIERLRGLRGARNCTEWAHKIGKDGLFIFGDEVDKRPMLIPCANGVVDLETGELTTGRPEDYLVRAIPVAFTDINKPAPQWERMIEEIHAHDRALIAFIHRFFGYCITGLCTEQVYACFIGEGANGKGTMFEILREILGELSWSINPDLLLDSKTTKSPDGPSPAIMSLQGRRLVVASETDEGRKLSAANIKRFTGDDTLTGRNLFDKFDTNFSPTHKLVLYTQHPPRGLASDFALKRRLLYITYGLRYVDDPDYHARQEPLQAHLFRKKDPELKAKLRQEKEGILAWLVRGCLLWQRDGLCIPDSIRAAVEEISLREDYVQQFVDAVCLRQGVEPGEGVTFKALYERYAQWYRDEIGNDDKDRRFLLSKRKFGEKLRAKGHVLPDKNKTSGTQVVLGVTFKGADYDDKFFWRGYDEGGGGS